MSIEIRNYQFDGPFGTVESLRNSSGVYAILTKGPYDSSSYTVIDIGESGDLRTRISGHDRKDCWTKNKLGAGIFVAAYYCNQADRCRIETELRFAYSPVCGDR